MAVPKIDVLVITYRVWVIRGLHALTVIQETDAGDALALAVAEGVHELLELSRALDLEEDFVVVIGDFDVEVLSLSILGLLLGRAVVRHVVHSFGLLNACVAGFAGGGLGLVRQALLELG